MRKMLLSMQPFWKEKIMTGEKIYEYRTRFPDEEILAYLYVSAPVCGIAGILHLGKPIFLSTWRESYKDDIAVSDRIREYESRKNKLAMPVLSYQETNIITRSELDDKMEKFVVPQSYYYLKDDMELTDYLSKHIRRLGKKEENVFLEDDSSNICRKYK